MHLSKNIDDSTTFYLQNY